MTERSKKRKSEKNKQTRQIVLIMAVCFATMILGGIGLANALDMGLTSPERYSDFQKLLERWGKDPNRQKFVSLYFLISFGLWILGGLGFLASLFSFVVSIFAFK